MKKFSAYLFLILFFIPRLLMSYRSNPKEFVNELVYDAITKLSDKDLNKDQKSSFIKNIALDNVDINALGLYTLGELRKSSSKSDIADYQETFEKYFLKSLTSRLTDYSSSKFEIVGEDKKSTNYTIVSSKILPGDGGQEIKIDWRIYTKNHCLLYTSPSPRD